MAHVDITIDGLRRTFAQLAETHARVDQLHAEVAAAAHTRKTEAGASVSAPKGPTDGA